MSPASYRTAPPRVARTTLRAAGGESKSSGHRSTGRSLPPGDSDRPVVRRGSREADPDLAGVRDVGAGATDAPVLVLAADEGVVATVAVEAVGAGTTVDAVVAE